MTPHVLITPSILAADLGHLQDEIESVERAGADWLQIDVMDGHFVPNLSFGAALLPSIHTKLPLDIHLMVTNPADRLREFFAMKAANITFHAEAVPRNSRRALTEAIRTGGATAGVAIKPGTPVEEIEDLLSDIDLVLVMSVEPGFSGQKFMMEVLDKVRAIHAAHPKLMIQMDGGIDRETAPLCIEAGATNLVAASAIFKAKDRAKAIASLRGT